MGFKFILPDIGEGVVEAEVQQWFVQPGDHVLEDQPLVEVMTDKATVTLPSPRRGTVTKLLYQPGQIAKVHEPLLEMVEDVHPDVEPSPIVEADVAEEARASAGSATSVAVVASARRPERKALAAPAG